MSNPLAATSEATSRPLGSEVKLERLERRRKVERKKIQEEERREKKRKGRKEGEGERRAGAVVRNKSYHIVLLLWLCKIPF